MGPWEGTQDGTRTSRQLLPRRCLHMPAAATLGGKDAGEGCRDTPHHPRRKHRPQLWLGLAQGSAGTPSSCLLCSVAGGKRCGPCVTRSRTRMSSSLSWPESTVPRETLTSKPRLPGCSGPPTAHPTHNPPGQGGITVQTGCAAGQSSLPGTAGGSVGSRGARRGAGPAPGGQGTGRGAGEHPRARPGSGLRPGTARHTVGVCQTARDWEAHPGPALPRHRRRFLSLRPACAQAQRHRHRRARKGSGRKWRKQDEAGRWRAGGAAVTSAPVRGAKGHLGVLTSPGCPAALPALGCSTSSSEETEARRPQLHAEPLALPGRETLPPAAAGMTPAPHPPPAPPCSCRNPGVRAPGRQPGPPSCLHLPPCLLRGRPRPAPALAPASLPGSRRHTPSHCVSGRPWSAAAAAPCQTSRRCPRHSRG